MVSVTNVRRVANSVSQCMPAVAMVLLGFSGCDVVYAMILLCLGFFFNGAISSGHMTSHVDLSPNFAGDLLKRNLKPSLVRKFINIKIYGYLLCYFG